MTQHEDLNIIILRSFRRNLPHEVAREMEAAIETYLGNRMMVVESQESEWVNPDSFRGFKHACNLVWEKITVEADENGMVTMHCGDLDGFAMDDLLRSRLGGEFNFFVDYLVNTIPILKFVVLESDDQDAIVRANEHGNLNTVHSRFLFWQVRIAV